MLNEEDKKKIEEHIAHYPQRRVACIDALKVVQDRDGWVSDQSIKDIAEFLDMSPDEVDNVATFYNLVFRKPVGRHVILVCDSVSCWIMDYDKILDHLHQKLGIRMGETTEDKRFTLLPIPCLGICDKAPALMIDNDLHTDVSVEKLDKILEDYA